MTLYLLPAPLADDSALAVLPPRTVQVARRLELFFAESAKTTRAFLKSIGHPRPLAELEIVEIGHHPEPAAIDGWLARLSASGDRVSGGGGAAAARDGAIVSEAGCPGIADPGADLVARAHALGIPVAPLVGPSALLLALMASGLDGQSFRFVGYLPQDGAALAGRLRELERASRAGETQLWIETPYRNDKTFDAVLAACAPDTRFTLAVDLTAPHETVVTRSITAWKAAARPTLHKRPAVFALLAARRKDGNRSGGR